MEKDEENQSNNGFSRPPLTQQEEIEINTFLSEINSTITEIRNTENKQYSILSCILNCFYENSVLSLPKDTIFNYIRQDVINYKGKMLVSFVDNGTNNKDTIDENNYIKKTNNILSRNKCLVLDANNRISIDIHFIEEHKNLMYRNLFGKETKLITKYMQLKKPRKPKIRNLGINMENDNSKGNKENKGETDYEIEIVGSEQDDTDNTDLNKRKNSLNNNISTFNYKNNSQKTKNNYSLESDNTDVNGLNSPSKIQETLYLNRKRKSKRRLVFKKKHDSGAENKDIANKIYNTLVVNEENIILDDKSEDISNIKDSDSSEKKVEIKSEKEILTFIEEGKMFLSLFKDKELMSELSKQKNNMNESDSYVKSILMNYQTDETFKKSLISLNTDYNEFEKNLNSLINYKYTINDSNNNKFMKQFSIINKIISGKEKCNLLIDKMITKLRQLILEYNFLKKVLNNVDANKADAFQKFKDIINNVSNKPDKENYTSDLKSLLQNELRKAIVLDNK